MAILSFEKINLLSSQKIELIFQYQKFHYKRIYDFGVSFNWSDQTIKNILANLGLVILFSEVQNIECDEILIKPIGLDREQIGFWRNLMINIASQKFFLEKKNFSQLPNKIIARGPAFNKKKFSVEDKILLGMGGGKESLTAEAIFHKNDIKVDEIIMIGYPNFLKKRQKIINHFQSLGGKTFKVYSPVSKDKVFLSPTPAAYPAVFRTIMVSLLFSYRFGYQYIVMASERSSNYGNTRWDGITANHQYDKSSIFLKKANDYIHNYITPNVNYFSPFEGLFEYKITQLLTQFPEYLDLLISCNSGTVKKKWCGNCYKCAFTYLLLCAFFEQGKINKVVGTNLFDRLDLFKPLIDFREIKPFDCVGTKEETWLALIRCIKKGYKGKVLDYFIKLIYPKIKKRLPELEEKYNKIYPHHIPSQIWEKLKGNYIRINN